MSSYRANYGANLQCLVMFSLCVVMPSVFTLADPPEVEEDRRVTCGVNVLWAAHAFLRDTRAVRTRCNPTRIFSMRREAGRWAFMTTIRYGFIHVALFIRACLVSLHTMKSFCDDAMRLAMINHRFDYFFVFQRILYNIKKILL